MENTEKLLALYNKVSKHANYQILFPALYEWLPEDLVHTRSRHEKERLDYILSKIDPQGKTFCDIGCNTGYFSFSLIAAGAAHGWLYEGNKTHAEFSALAGRQLGYDAKLTVRDIYFDFQKKPEESYDLLLLLNVLHHVGDDYGYALDAKEALNTVRTTLNSLTQVAGTMIFQLGFNWMGDPARGLFPHGTKQEMIDWLKESVQQNWKIEAIGIAQRQPDGTIAYKDLNGENSKRDDSLGEFLNRPLFILKRK